VRSPRTHFCPSCRLLTSTPASSRDGGTCAVRGGILAYADLVPEAQQCTEALSEARRAHARARGEIIKPAETQRLRAAAERKPSPSCRRRGFKVPDSPEGPRATQRTEPRRATTKVKGSAGTRLGEGKNSDRRAPGRQGIRAQAPAFDGSGRRFEDTTSQPMGHDDFFSNRKSCSLIGHVHCVIESSQVAAEAHVTVLPKDSSRSRLKRERFFDAIIS